MTPDSERIESLLRAVAAWAAGRRDVEAVLLVGSYAHGTATHGSDVDLVVVVTDPQLYVRDPAWAGTFGTVVRTTIEDWGKVTALRVWYRGGPEVELGFTSPDWMAAPVDEGTRQVLTGGFRVLYGVVPSAWPVPL